jgi:hypothetical protein
MKPIRHSHPFSRLPAHRGSVLIVAMLIAAIIGISLVSYIKLTATSFKLAHRTFFSDAASNLVETGLEEAVYSFNAMGSGTAAATVWSSTNGWTTNTTKVAGITIVSGGSGYASAPTVLFLGGGGSGATAAATISAGAITAVTISNGGSGYTSAPTIFFAGGSGAGASATTTNTSATRTLSTFNLDQNATGVVQIYVAGYDGSYATPLAVAKATITPFDGGAPIVKIIEVALKFNGPFMNGLVAKNGITWNGHPTADSWNSNPVNSSTGPWVTYASATHNANTTVASLSGTVSLGSQGSISGNLALGSTAIYSGSNTITGTITYNFNNSLAMPTYPATSTLANYYTLAPAISGILPRNLDTTNSPGTDDTYYYFVSGGTIGNTIIAANSKVVIVGNLTTNVTGTVTIPTTGSLKIYTDGTINGTYLNSAWAGALQLFTSTTSGTTISGNQNILACIYAPNSPITGNGGGNSGAFYGSVVGATVTSNGHMDFHYDEALKSFSTGKPWTLNLWRELQSSSERAIYATQLNF